MTHSQKVFVLDTNVLLSEGSKALRNYGPNIVVIPIVVVEELESKRNEPFMIGKLARDVLRTLEEYNVQSGGNIKEGAVINDSNGIVKIEMNHVSETDWLPEIYKYDKRNDIRIITVAGNLIEIDGYDVTLVSKDLPMRLKASAIHKGIKTSTYETTETHSGGYIGVKDVLIDSKEIDKLHKDRMIDGVKEDNDPANLGVVLSSYSGNHKTLAVQRTSPISKTATIHKIKEVNDVFGVKPRSAGQKIAVNYLMDPLMSIVSLGGKAGTGKTLLAVSAGLEQIMETHTYKKVTVFRPLYAVGGQDLGYLPGTEEEKMAPWTEAIFDSISHNSAPILDEVKDRGYLQILPITHIRGRSLHDTFMIVDEAQNFDVPTLLTILSRVGENSKIVFCWDGAQKDNQLIGKNDGIISLIDMLRDEGTFAHVSLMKSERSPVAELAANLLEAYIG